MELRFSLEVASLHDPTLLGFDRIFPGFAILRALDLPEPLFEDHVVMLAIAFDT